jgi:hypothetical protein
MLQALFHPEQVRKTRSGDGPDDATVPVQAGERRDADRPHHLTGSGPAHQAATPLVEAREVSQITLQGGAPEGQARMVAPGRVQRLQAGPLPASWNCGPAAAVTIDSGGARAYPAFVRQG